jgi:prepilin-type N-terminal cleavage/methylation domain-containing protein
LKSLKSLKSLNDLNDFNDFDDFNGFTLLEILLTIVILGIALIPLMELLPRALVHDAQVERETKVAFLAQQKLEEVKSKAIYDFNQDYNESATAFPSPDSTFKYTVSDDQGSEIKEIAVNVWYDRNGDNDIDDDEEEIELNTKVAERN